MLIDWLDVRKSERKWNNSVWMGLFSTHQTLVGSLQIIGEQQKHPPQFLQHICGGAGQSVLPPLKIAEQDNIL